MEKYIADEARLIKPSPSFLVENGKANFGSFKESLNNINLLDVKGQSRFLPSSFNSARLTEWEAFELDFKEGTLVSAVYKNLKYNGMGILVYYDKLEDKIYSFRAITTYNRVHVANNLIIDNSYINVRGFNFKIINDFKNDKARIIANLRNKNNKIEIDVNVCKLSQSSIVSIPLGINKPLYSEKAFLSASGSVVFNDKHYNIGNDSIAIIDDHKSYYPYRSHYDWLTSVGIINIAGRDRYFGFNLTKNQSLDENKYNENNIWLDNEFYYLPPVEFKKSSDSWLISDKYDYVRLELKINKIFKMGLHLGFIDLKYLLPFGMVSGYVRGHNGEKIIIDKLIGIAEDKTTRL